MRRDTRLSCTRFGSLAMFELISLAEPARLLFGAILVGALLTSFAHIQYLRRTCAAPKSAGLRRAKSAI